MDNRKGYPKQSILKFYAILWVTQEILKAIPTDPPWEQGLHRKNLEELQYDDPASLRSETEENSRLILAHHPQIKKLENLLSVNRQRQPLVQPISLEKEPDVSPITKQAANTKRQGRRRWFGKMFRRLFKVCNPETVDRLLSEKEK